MLKFNLKKVQYVFWAIISFFSAIYFMCIINEGTLTTDLQRIFISFYFWTILLFILIIIKKKYGLLSELTKRKGVFGLLILLSLGMTFVSWKFNMPREYLDTSVTIKVLNENNLNSQGKEAWLTEVKLDGSSVSVDDVLEIPETGWLKSGSALYANGEENPENLLLRVPKKKEMELQFNKHAWSGIIQVNFEGREKVYDLYDSVGGSVSIVVPAYFREYSGFTEIIILVGIFCTYFIALYSIFTITFWKRGHITFSFMLVLLGVLCTFAAYTYFQFPQMDSIIIQPLQEHNLDSNGSEVWITSIGGANSSYFLEQVDLSAGWFSKDGILVTTGENCDPLVISVDKTENITLSFIMHQWSGKVKVQRNDIIKEIDLYSLNGDSKTVVLEGAKTDNVLIILILLCLWGIICFLIFYKQIRKYRYLFIIMVLLGTFIVFFLPSTTKTSVILTAGKSKNELSKGYEVWLTDIEINGTKAQLNDYPVNGKWKHIGESIVYIIDSPKEDSNLILNFSNASDVRLIFSGHLWSGVVGIQEGNKYTELDLYNSTDKIEYKLENIVPFNYSLIKFIFSNVLIILMAWIIGQKCISKYANNTNRLMILLISAILLDILHSRNYIPFILLVVLVCKILKNGDNDFKINKKQYIGLWAIIILCWSYRIFYLTNPVIKQPWIVYSVFLCLYLLILIDKEKNKKRWPQLAIILLLPCLEYFILESVSNVDLNALSLKVSIINILLIALLTIIIINLLDYKKIGWYIAPTMFFCVSVVNYYVIQFKKFALMPADILQFKTAISVAGDYKYVLSDKIITGALTLIILFVLIYLYVPRYNFNLKRTIQRKGIAFLAIVILVFWVKNVDFTKEYNIVKNDWDTSVTYSQNGFVVSFISYLQTMYPEKPDGYNVEKVEQILAQYNDAEDIKTSEKPTIIAIMNESFSDLKILGDLGDTDDVMWFMNSYGDFIEKGNAYVSVRGGGTCNSEFEFLTGNSMEYFANSYPYTQYNFDTVPTLVSSLKEQGYKTVAMHPANPTNYKRKSVYQQMGFDEFYSYDEFIEYERIFLDRTSDLDNYKKIIEVVESSEEPLFLFNVTLQNHGDYNIETLNPKYGLISVDSKYSAFKDLQMYLTLINESNKALEYLISHFEHETKPVIICFFGDHQPGCLDEKFESSFFEYDNSQSDLANTERYYATPYFFWANFEIKQNNEEGEETFNVTSPNYLATKLLYYAGLTQNSYEKFLAKMHENIPVTNRFGYMGKNGIWYSYKDNSPYIQWIDEYKMIQYYNMFDR